MKKIFWVILFLLKIINEGFCQKSGTIVFNESVNVPCRREIAIPDVLGFKTLKCDFHIHTVYSDGFVWPTLRVNEAWEEGLDAIAITDHIENQPSKFPGQKHQAYEIALPIAKTKNIILIKGGEITRKMPPGHLNAIFIQDVNALNTPNYMDAIAEAIRQGGFILWNHPGWRHHQPDTTRWMPEHEELYKKGWLHGIEVFNEKEWYPEALQWAIEKKLSILCNTDIHDVIIRRYNKELYPIRPITLVFAKERTEESIKEAMFAKQTAALFFNHLVGPKRFIDALVYESIKISEPFYTNDENIYFEVTNLSDIEFILKKIGNDIQALPDRIVLPARSTINCSMKQPGKTCEFIYSVENTLVNVDEHVMLKIKYSYDKNSFKINCM